MITWTIVDTRPLQGPEPPQRLIVQASPLRTARARKPYTCDRCGSRIDKTTSYVSWTQFDDPDYPYRRFRAHELCDRSWIRSRRLEDNRGAITWEDVDKPDGYNYESIGNSYSGISDDLGTQQWAELTNQHSLSPTFNPPVIHAWLKSISPIDWAH